MLVGSSFSQRGGFTIIWLLQTLLVCTLQWQYYTISHLIQLTATGNCRLWHCRFKTRIIWQHDQSHGDAFPWSDWKYDLLYNFSIRGEPSSQQLQWKRRWTLKYGKSNTALSPKAQENLKRNAELRDKDNKFIKIQPNEKRVLEFNPEKIEQVEREFNGKRVKDIGTL